MQLTIGTCETDRSPVGSCFHGECDRSWYLRSEQQTLEAWRLVHLVLVGIASPQRLRLRLLLAPGRMTSNDEGLRIGQVCPQGKHVHASR
jgi:hypothetical protein